MSRRPARILLATIGSLGDLNPMIALSLELGRRGHRTAIATTPFYRRKVEETGLDFRPLRPDMSPDDPELMSRIMDPRRGPEFMIRRIFMPRLREMYADLEAAAADADFIVCGELVYATKLLAERRGLRWALALLQPAVFFSVHDPSVIATIPFTEKLHGAPKFIHRSIHWLGRAIGESWTKPVAELRRELGLRAVPAPLFEGKYSPFLNLALFSRVIAAPQPDWPGQTVQTGFLFYDKRGHAEVSPPGLAAFLDAGEPPIVFTLGSSAVHTAGRFYDESIEAATRLGRRAILLAGKNLLRRELPPGMAAFDYAPFSEVFPRAACVVHQGGMGTTAQVLTAGVPHLVMPYGFDQPDNAARLLRLGVARKISIGAYNGMSAAKVLAELLGDVRYAARARAVAAEVRAEDGLGAACDAIERALVGGE